MNELIEETTKKFHIPGASFAVVHNDQTWFKSIGLAQQEGPKQPVDEGTLFYAASTTKAILCAVWAIYMASDENQNRPEEERITWKTPLVNLVRDDFVLQDPFATGRITLEDAVTHRMGMARHDLCYGKHGASTPKAVTRALRHLPLHNDLRTDFEYCNLGYIAASHALETVTGKILSDLLHETLWEPLGMQQSCAGYCEASKAIHERGAILAKGTSWSCLPTDPDAREGHLVEDKEYLDFPEISGAGYVISCARDYAKWMLCLLSQSSPMSDNIVNQLWTPRTILQRDEWACAPLDGGNATYALGWFTGLYRGQKIVYHPGNVLTSGSLIMLVPELKWGVSLFANASDAGESLRGMAFEMLDDHLGIAVEERYAKQRIEEALLRVYRDLSQKAIDARSRLYPGAPSWPQIPLSLPIQAYAGCYKNIGYGSCSLEVQSAETCKEKLSISWDRCWGTQFHFERVNGEHWLVRQHAPNGFIELVTKAQSRIGADGKVEGFDIVMDPEMPETMMWFDKK